MSRSAAASCPVMAGAGSPGGRVKDTKHSTGTLNPQLSRGVGSTLLLSENVTCEAVPQPGVGVFLRLAAPSLQSSESGGTSRSRQRQLLAAAWIQFEVHDWFSHGTVDWQLWAIALEEDDPWPDRPMRIDRTAPDPSADPQGPPTYVTQDTHWWDGSQICGGATNLNFADALRSGNKGQLRIDDLGLPPADVDQYLDLTGIAGNFWVSLAILHSLFMREHTRYANGSPPNIRTCPIGQELQDCRKARRWRSPI